MVRLTIHGMSLLAAAMVVAGCTVHESVPTSPDVTSFAPPPDSSLQSLLALARLSERQGQTDQANRLYHVVIEREPTNPIPHHRLGVMSAKERRFQDSDRHFSKAIELDPSNPQLLSDIGYSYYLQHRLHEAETMLRRAAAIPNDDPAVSNNLGLVLGDQGRYDESMTEFRREGDGARAHANQAYVHAQRGELKDARSNYSRALTLDTDLQPAAVAMVQLAEHEQLSQSQPAEPVTPQPDTRQASLVIPLPPIETQQAPLPPHFPPYPLSARTN